MSQNKNQIKNQILWEVIYKEFDKFLPLRFEFKGYRRKVYPNRPEYNVYNSEGKFVGRISQHPHSKTVLVEFLSAIRICYILKNKKFKFPTPNTSLDHRNNAIGLNHFFQKELEKQK